MERVLVLGAYGHVGKFIVPELAGTLGLEVIATGRNLSKLETLYGNQEKNQIHVKKLDAFDFEELKKACKNVDLVINGVGPYAKDFWKVAGEIVNLGVNYLDFANEQSHYRHLKDLGERASENGLKLVTGVGTSPGISTILYRMTKLNLPDMEYGEMQYVSGIKESPEEGFGSVMGAILETGINPVAYIDGELKPMPLGREKKIERYPEPFNKRKFLAFPTIDALIVPNVLNLNTLRTYWAMGDIPPGFSSAIKFFKPHKRQWAYNLFKMIAKSSMKKEYNQSKKDGLGLESMMKIIGKAPQQESTTTITFPRGGGASASYMVLITTKLLSENRIEKKGLITPADLDIMENFESLLRLFSWTGSLTTEMNKKS